jgi:hypothetical protein
MSTPLLRRSATQKGAPQGVDRDAPQASHREFGLIVFLALAAMLSFIWLAIRGPALLERMSSWRPMCSLVSCETQAQADSAAQAQPEPKSALQPQPQAQHQSQPQPPRPPLPPRPHLPDRVMMDECPPLRYRTQYSRGLREPQRRFPIECWRDRSIRGPCFD